MKNIFTQIAIEYNNLVIRSNGCDLGRTLSNILSGDSESVGKDLFKVLGHVANIAIYCRRNENLKKELEA